MSSIHSDPASPSSPNDAHSYDVIRHRPAGHGHADDATLDMNEDHSFINRAHSTYPSNSSTHSSGFLQQLYPRTLLQQASTILLILLVYLVYIGPLSPDYALNQASQLNNEILSRPTSTEGSCPPAPIPVRPSCPPAPECPLIEPTVCPPPPVAPLLVRVHSMRLHSTPAVNASASSDESQLPVPNPQTLRGLRGQVNEQAESIALCPATSTQDDDTNPDSSCHAEAVKWSRSTGVLRGSTKGRPIREDPQALPSCFVQSGIQGLGAFRQPHLSTFVDEKKVGDLPPYRVDYSWGSHLTTYDRGATAPLPFLDYTGLRTKLSRSNTAPIANPTSTTRILFVTEEMSDMGLPPATLPYGGAGSAISLLAQALAAAKSEDGTPLYSVHVLHCKLHTISGEDVETARAALQARGIRLHAFPPHIANMRLDAYYASQSSYRVLLFLLQAESKGIAGDSVGAQPFDVVHVYDYGGLGYHALRAREQGWALRSSAFICTAHGPASWATAANAQYPHEVEELEVQLLERRSVEWSDVFLSPSQYMASYMLKRQWQMPSLSVVIPNVQPEPEALLSSSSDSDLTPIATPHSDEPPCEIVFFGRLEERKGLAIFLDAIAKLLTDSHSDMFRHFKLTFLGRQLVNPATGQASHEFIRDRISGWSMKLKSKFIRRFGLPPLRLISDASRIGALAYLSQKDSGRVAVMASLMDNSPYVIVECLQAKVPFIASKVGGIPELIDSNDQERVLFEPNVDSLTKKLRALIMLPSGGEVSPFAPEPAGAAFDREQITAQHLALHRDLAVAAQSRKNGGVVAAAAAVTDGDGGADSGSDSETPTAPVAQAIPQLASLYKSPLPPLVAADGDAIFTEAESLPLVSVCITHYERATLLLHTLDGLAAQSYPASRLQVIVIDDGSPDVKTRALLDQNVKPFVANQGKLWSFRSITNSYLGSARNQCRQWMKGEFFLFLDDDDFPHPSMVERFVQTALMTKAQLLSTHFQLFWGEQHPSAIFDLQGASRSVGVAGNDNAPAVSDDAPYGRGIGWPLYPRSDVDHQSSLNAANPTVFLFLGSSLSTSFFTNSAGGANIFVRSCVFDVLGGFTEYRQVGFEDYEFLVNAAAHRVRHEVIEQPLLLVRRHVNSVSMQSQTVASLNRARVLSRFLDTFSHSDVALDLSPLLLMTWGLHEEHKQTHAASLTTSNILADSEKQYSGIQGQDGWWYALLLLIDDFTGELMNPNLLRRPLAQEHEHEVRHGGSEEEVRRAAFFSATYTDGRWGCDRSTSSLCPIALRRSTYTWPEHRQWFTHPATSLPDARDWRWSMHPVRRWVSHVQASVIITVGLEFKQRECGEGVVYSLWIDRARVWKYNESKERKKAEKARKGGVSADAGVGPIVDVDPRSLSLNPAGSNNNNNHNPHGHHSSSNCVLDGQILKCHAQLRVGSMVDFIVSPGPTEICDASVVRIKIRRA